MGHHQPPEPSVPRNELNAQTLLYANGSIEDRREDRIWFDPKHGYGFIKLALLWQIYLRRCVPPICLLQYGHR